MKMIAPLIVALLFSSVSAEDSKNSEKRGRKGRGFFKELNLSKEQIEKLKAHRKENKGQLKGKMKEMKSLREELDSAFLKGASDSDLTGISKKMSVLKAEMENSKLQKMIFMKNLLTEEQRKAFIEKKKSRKGKRGARFKKRNQD